MLRSNVRAVAPDASTVPLLDGVQTARVTQFEFNAPLRGHAAYVERTDPAAASAAGGASATVAAWSPVAAPAADAGVAAESESSVYAQYGAPTTFMASELAMAERERVQRQLDQEREKLSSFRQRVLVRVREHRASERRELAERVRQLTSMGAGVYGAGDDPSYAGVSEGAWQDVDALADVAWAARRDPEAFVQRSRAEQQAAARAAEMQRERERARIAAFRAQVHAHRREPSSPSASSTSPRASPPSPGRQRGASPARREAAAAGAVAPAVVHSVPALVQRAGSDLRASAAVASSVSRAEDIEALRLRKRRERDRYFAALRARLLDAVSTRRVSLLPLCACGTDPLARNAFRCCANSEFRSDPARFAQLVAVQLSQAGISVM